MIADVDKVNYEGSLKGIFQDGSGTIDFDEFLDMMKKKML